MPGAAFGRRYSRLDALLLRPILHRAVPEGCLAVDDTDVSALRLVRYGPRLGPSLLALDRDELDVEHEHSVRRATATIGQRFGDPEAPRLACDHQLNALRPSLDYPVQREARRRARLGAIELLAVGRPARVVHRYFVRGRRMHLARARLDYLRCQARRGLARILGWRRHIWGSLGERRD